MDQIAKASSWKLVECDRQPPHCWLLNRQLVVSAPHVLHQRMPRRDYSGPTVLLGPLASAAASPSAGRGHTRPGCWHTDPCRARRWQQSLQHRQVHRRLIGGDLDRCDLGRPDRCAKNADPPVNQSREAHLPARPLHSPEGAVGRVACEIAIRCPSDGSVSGW